jgi:hypothetical protein
MQQLTTISTIKVGYAELSDWILIEGHPDNGMLLCRVVLSLQRWVLVQLEADDRLMWVPNNGSISFIPTEPAEQAMPTAWDLVPRGPSPLLQAFEHKQLADSMIAAVHRSFAMGFLAEPSDFTDDPGTPPDLR